MNKVNNIYIDIIGRKKTFMHRIYNLICICTFGIFYIICKYNRRLKMNILTKKSKLKYADCVIIKNKYGKMEICDIIEYDYKKTTNLYRYNLNGKIRVLDTLFNRFIYDTIMDKFVIYPFIKETSKPFGELFFSKMNKSEESEELELREKEVVYGLNNINIKILSTQQIFIKNTFTCSNFINILCVILWFLIDYKTYGSIICLMLLYSYFIENLSDFKSKWEMEEQLVCKKIRVLRNGKFKWIDTKYIFPGDLVYIEPCTEFCCDAILVRGDVISDESFLTGESVPIYKSSTQRSTVYSGTSILRSVEGSAEPFCNKYESLCRVKNLIKKDTEKVVERSTTRFDCAIGFVVSTGASTSRGKIMRDIVNPKPVYISFLEDAHRYILCTITYAIFISILLSIYFHSILKWDWHFNLIVTLDVLFTLANPYLVTSLNCGIQFSANNLQKEGIKCSNKDRIYIAGNVDVCVFDKTGTLTSDGVQLLCIDDCIQTYDVIEDTNVWCRIGLSTCHSVYELDGKYAGDFLDMQMFAFSKCTMTILDQNIRQITLNKQKQLTGPFLKEYGETNMEYYNTIQGCCDSVSEIQSGVDFIEIIKTYDFSSEQKRMSVIVKIGDKKYLFCKGSADIIGNLLSDTPENYYEKVKDHSLSGYRVISMAYREITEVKGREEDERNLKFLGLIIFSNKLKEETTGVISELNQTNIKSVICTGDSMLTAVSVGRECGIVDDMIVIFPVVNENCKSVYDVEWGCLGGEELIFDKFRLMLYKDYDTCCSDFVIACEGKEYEFLKGTQYSDFLLQKCLVFARFDPGQKKSLVEDFRNKGLKTLFCGDGANDSAAISSAEVGVALVKNEASLASSFCSSSLCSVPLLIKESRNAYITSVARFKYISVSYILAFACLAFPLLRGLILSDLQTLHTDVFIIVPLSFFLSNFKKSKTLSRVLPNQSPFNLKSMFPTYLSLILQCGIIGMMSRIGDASDKLTENSKAATLIFFVVCFQLIFNCLYFSDCTPHRESLMENKKLWWVAFSISIYTSLLLFLNMICYDFTRTNWFLKKYLFVKIDFYDLIVVVVNVLLSGVSCIIVPYYTGKVFNITN